MDPTEYLQQCAQEDQVMLDEYMASRPVTSPSSADTAFINHYETVSPGNSHDAPSQTFKVSTHLKWGCSMSGCTKADKLTVCPICKAVQYCKEEHRLLDRPGHRSVCAKIKKSFRRYKNVEAILRGGISDTMFERGWGFIKRLGESQFDEYKRDRRCLIEAFLKSNTAKAVTLALDHLLDMLRLWRTDRIGARDVVPALLIRLGRVQEAYDFCHWWATTGGADFPWRDEKAPYLDTKDADIFEGVDIFTQAGGNLSHLVAMALIKIRLLMDLHSVQRARELAGPHVPREILDTIQHYSIVSIIAGESRIIERDDQTRHIANLRKQILELYTLVKDLNPHFWPALVDPGEHLTARPTSYKRGNEGQMQFTLQYNYNAWSETPGSIGIIEELLESYIVY